MGDYERLMASLADAGDKTGRRAVLRDAEAAGPALVSALYEETVKLTRVDLRRAHRMAQTARWLASRLGDDYARAQALRATGHVLYARGRYEQAVDRYEAALALLRAGGHHVDVGRTLSGGLHSLIYLGRYDQALQWAREAREIFERVGDRLRLARLDHNSANIYYRQDRFEEALELYRQAYSDLQASGNATDIAAVLSNMAVCSISLNDFTGALRYYREARAHCERHGMPLLVAEADYNVAYLHYLRGEYVRAIELYGQAREHCRRLDDRYHAALCDLDQSEMYLELNLVEEGGDLAARARDRFRELGMPYEVAKATAFVAIAASHQGRTERALELFTAARKLFVAERNRIWPGLIDLYEALVLFRAGDHAAARRLAHAALRAFRHANVEGRAALCELLLARIALAGGRARAAARYSASALGRLREADSPALACHAWSVEGQVREALGEAAAALAAWRQAHARLEDLRSNLRGEELKIAFLKDKLAVYESLVWMSREQPEEAFAYIEQAKSRSLADLIAFRLRDLPASPSASGELVEQVRRLRDEISLSWRRIESHQVRPEEHTDRYVEGLRRRIRDVEGRLAGTLDELSKADRDFAALQNGHIASLAEVRTALPPGTRLLEYYQARGRLYACVVGPDRLDLVPLGEAQETLELFRLLRFQLSKFHLRAEYLEMFAGPLLEATSAHLAELYSRLIAPVRPLLDGAARLVVVPHGFLHYLPFHALADPGGRYLGDDFTLSYAPSANVYCLCSAKRAAAEAESLVLGIPDQLTPHISGEVEAVAASVGTSRVFLGADATIERLRQYGPGSRIVHIATHGLFRQDNPMFSSIRLGDAPLTLYDLYGLRLGAELVTLSGCGTGLNAVVGADELLGLLRGLLYAGARSVLASLWDVNDLSTAEFMRSFYGRLRQNPDKAAALAGAMRDLRERYPHPYYWAPFVLVGAALPHA